MSSENKPQAPATTLEQIVANTCFCKLRESCPDKNSPECMKHKNIFLEFMQSKAKNAH